MNKNSFLNKEIIPFTPQISNQSMLSIRARDSTKISLPIHSVRKYGVTYIVVVAGSTISARLNKHIM